KAPMACQGLPEGVEHLSMFRFYEDGLSVGQQNLFTSAAFGNAHGSLDTIEVLDHGPSEQHQQSQMGDQEGDVAPFERPASQGSNQNVDEKPSQKGSEERTSIGEMGGEAMGATR